MLFVLIVCQPCICMYRGFFLHTGGSSGQCNQG